MKFLVDECLSPELTKLAHDRGHGKSSHVAWLGKNGAKDWKLKPFIIDGDWTFVTKNSVDFRGSSSRPVAGFYAASLSPPSPTRAASDAAMNSSRSPSSTFCGSLRSTFVRRSFTI